MPLAPARIAARYRARCDQSVRLITPSANSLSGTISGYSGLCGILRIEPGKNVVTGIVVSIMPLWAASYEETAQVSYQRAPDN
jgi:hypothetical protein